MDATTIFNHNEAGIEVERNSRSHNWKIKAYGDDMDEILRKIKETEDKIKALYPIE
jgi:hypothetical protein